MVERFLKMGKKIGYLTNMVLHNLDVINKNVKLNILLAVGH